MSLGYIMANQYELEGTLKQIDDTQTFNSGFQKREFVVTTDDKYPQDIKFEVLKDKCSLLDKFQTGQAIKVSFDIRGNEYKGRYYVNLNAWKLETADASDTGSAPADDRPDNIVDAAGDSYVELDEEPF